MGQREIFTQAQTRLYEGLNPPAIVATYLDLIGVAGIDKAEDFLEAVTGQSGDTLLLHGLHAQVYREIARRALALARRSKDLLSPRHT